MANALGEVPDICYNVLRGSVLPDVSIFMWGVWCVLYFRCGGLMFRVV